MLRLLERRADPGSDFSVDDDTILRRSGLEPGRMADYLVVWGARMGEDLSRLSPATAKKGKSDEILS